MAHLIFPTINSILHRHGQLLLSRRQNTGWMDGKLCLPGGHIEVGESPRTGMVREIKEELGLDVKPSDLQFVCVVQRKSEDREQVAYVFSIECREEPVNAEPEKCSELVWAHPNELPEDTIEAFRIIITEGYLKRRTYLEIGYD